MHHTQLDWFNVPDETDWSRKPLPTPSPNLKLDTEKEWKVGENG